MKRIAAFLLTVMMVGWALAQRQNYLREDFSSVGYLDTNVWDLKATKDLNEKTLELLYPQNSNNAGGVAPEGMYGYLPNSGLADLIKDELRLISKPFATTKENVRNYVAFKCAYEAAGATSRSFGIALRKGSGEWTVCTQIASLTATSDGAELNHLVAEMPADFNQTNDVQLSVFHKGNNKTTQYLLFFDDIEAFAIDKDYYGFSYSWSGKPYTTDGTLKVGLLIENTGNVMDSCVISYTLNGGAVKTMPIKFDRPFYPGHVYEKTNFVPEGWDATQYGHQRIDFWISKVDNQAVAEDKIEKQIKYLNNIDPATTPAFTFRPLVEHLTSSTCPPCATVNGYMNPLYEELKDTMTLIKYQMNWPGYGDPYYTREGGVRRTYYDPEGVPEAYLNGTAYLPINSAKESKTAILKVAGKKVYYSVWIDTAAIDANQNIHLTVKAKSACGMDNVRLHTVVMEKVTTGNASSNGEKEFHHVMMKMLPTPEGALLHMMPDSTYTFTYVYDMTKTYMEEFNDLLAACFLQSDETGEVFQSAIREVGAYGQSAGLTAEVNYMPTYVCGTDIPVGLKLTGMGVVPTTEVEITAKVGSAGTPVTHTYTTNLAWSQSTYVSFNDLKPGTASDTVFIKVSKLNGEAYEGVVMKRTFVVKPTQYAFVPLLEGFVSPSANGSNEVHEYLDAIEANSAITAKFPMTGHNYTRQAYTRYAENIGAAAPAMVLNGSVIPVPASDVPANKLYADELLAQIKKCNSVMSMKNSDEVTVDGSRSVYAKLDIVSEVDMKARLFAYVIESVTEKSNGGEEKRLVQAFMPNENGTSVTIKSGKATAYVNNAIMSPKVENYANLSLVIVIKDNAGKEVLQTAEYPIVNKGAANESLNVCETLNVYPNPASEYVYLKALQNAYVEVSDMNGVKVFDQNSINGDYTLNVQGYTPGMYVIKVREGVKTSVAKITVTR